MEYKLPEAWFQCIHKEEIGTGAYGTVYKIEDPDHNTSAVKVLNIPSTEEEAQVIKNEMKDPGLVRKYFTNLIDDFMREIQIMESLRDTTNVVQLKSHYLESNAIDEKWTIYIQMEVLTSLTRYTSTHAMAEDEVILLGIDLLKAIRDCNKKDIIHRDIKPDNIMVAKDGTFKLGDFGIARHVEKTARTLSIRGTFSYMAPEIFHSESYGKTVDLYSLGLVMYRLLNKNRDPFVSTTKKLVYFKDKEEALKQRMEGQEIPPPVNASEELAEIILRACAYNVEDRYQCAEDMLRDLTDLQLGLYIKGRSYADRSTMRRLKLVIRKKRKEMLIILGLILCLAGVAAFSYRVKPKVPIQEWHADSVNVSEKLEKKAIEDAKILDEIVWESMTDNDPEAFLSAFDNYTMEDYQAFYNDYYLLSESKKYLKSDYDEHLKDYQEKSETYTHVIGQDEENCYVEVVRYYMGDLPFEDITTDSDHEHYYEGVLLQSSMYYIVAKEGDNSNLIDYRNEKDECIYDLVYPFKYPVNVASENGYANYLYLNQEFVYPGYYRISPVASYVDAEHKKITFILSIKNGMNKDVTIEDLSVEYIMKDNSEGYPNGEDRNIQYVSKSNTNTCISLTYKVQQPENMDIYNNGSIIKIRFDTDLEGVKE